MPKHAVSLCNVVTFPPLERRYYKLYLGELPVGGEVALTLGSCYRPNYVLLERNTSCILLKKK